MSPTVKESGSTGSYVESRNSQELFSQSSREISQKEDPSFDVFKGTYSYPEKRTRSEKITIYVREQD